MVGRVEFSPSLRRVPTLASVIITRITASYERVLAGFGISSSTKRVGEKTFKGYDLDQFSEAFSRYLACENVTESQNE
jgi:hypothetical protein